MNRSLLTEVWETWFCIKCFFFKYTIWDLKHLLLLLSNSIKIQEINESLISQSVCSISINLLPYCNFWSARFAFIFKTKFYTRLINCLCGLITLPVHKYLSHLVIHASNMKICSGKETDRMNNLLPEGSMYTKTSPQTKSTLTSVLEKLGKCQ